MKMESYKADEMGTVRRAHPKISRNAPCPCGSKNKYKRCCLPVRNGGKAA